VSLRRHLTPSCSRGV